MLCNYHSENSLMIFNMLNTFEARHCYSIDDFALCEFSRPDQGRQLVEVGLLALLVLPLQVRRPQLQLRPLLVP